MQNSMVKPKTPLLVIGCRVLFASLFTAGFIDVWFDMFPSGILSIAWLGYLIVMYALAEYVYLTFKRRGIDLSFAFPLLFAVFLLNFVSELLNAQVRIPDINRAEHFTSFILISYIVWTFFTKYLPHEVWQKHPYYTSILAFSVVSAFGVCNEIIELFLDLMFKLHTVGPGYDTSFDLVMNTLGATLFLCSRLIYGALNEEK